MIVGLYSVLVDDFCFLGSVCCIFASPFFPFCHQLLIFYRSPSFFETCPLFFLSDLWLPISSKSPALDLLYSLLLDAEWLDWTLERGWVWFGSLRSESAFMSVYVISSSNFIDVSLWGVSCSRPRVTNFCRFDLSISLKSLWSLSFSSLYYAF